jgi:hypothetical protein
LVWAEPSIGCQPGTRLKPNGRAGRALPEGSLMITRSAMAQYRLVLRDTKDQPVGDPQFFKSADFMDAVERATALLNGQYGELWEGDRLVIRART